MMPRLNLGTNWQIMKAIVGLLIGYLVCSDRRDGIEANSMPVSSNKDGFAAWLLKSSRSAWVAGLRHIAGSPTMRSKTKFRPWQAERRVRRPEPSSDKERGLAQLRTRRAVIA